MRRSISGRQAETIAIAQKAATATPAVDMVNSPPHYNQDDGIECIDAIRAQLGLEGYISYLRGTIAKYNWRLMRKFNPVEDAQKQQWYTAKLIEALQEWTENHKELLP